MKVCSRCGELKEDVDDGWLLCSECGKEVLMLGDVEESIRKLRISDERVELLMGLVKEFIVRE